MDKVDSPSYSVIRDDGFGAKLQQYVGWTGLPSELVVDLFTRLNYRDRASLASTCSSWRSSGASSSLWSSLDTRVHNFDPSIAASLANRCGDLEKVWFRSCESAEAIIHLKARNLLEISGDYCWNITDGTLAMIAARHEALESLKLGPDYCENITSDGIRLVAFCCPKLRKLHLSGVRDVTREAIESFGKYCTELTDLGFLDCFKIDEEALGKVVSLRYLSVAGTLDIDWNVATESWEKLPRLIGLNVSRTDIDNTAVFKLLESSESLEILCALNCPFLEEDTNFSSYRCKGKVLLSPFNNTFDELASFFDSKKPDDVFSYWRGLTKKDRAMDEKMRWIEWSISHTLQRSADCDTQGLNGFWLGEGTRLLLGLMQSSQEDVQEMAVRGLATFIIDNRQNNAPLFTYHARVEAVLGGGGIEHLLKLAKSLQEGLLQSEVAKAISHLSNNVKAAKAIVEQGWISVLIGLVKSTTRLVAEEAADGLWNISGFDYEYKTEIIQGGGLKALIELIFRWKIVNDLLLQRAAGALASIALDPECSEEVVRAGGVPALVMLIRDSQCEGVALYAARGLTNITAYDDNNIVGQEPGAFEALVKLTKSNYSEQVKQEAAEVLEYLAFDEENREPIAAVGGIEALVALVKSYETASTTLQERAIGALRGLADSEANSIAIGQEGVVPPLIDLAESEDETVQETAVEALWTLSFNLGNALRIVEEGGVGKLIYLVSSSLSKTGRFTTALALANILDGRLVEMVGTGPGSPYRSILVDGSVTMALNSIEAFIKTFTEPEIDAAATLSFSPSVLAKHTEKARINDAGCLRCSGPKIGRFVTMLRNPCHILKSFAAFVLLQFTVPQGRYARHHASLLQDSGEARLIRSAAAATNMPRQAKIFAEIVLQNLEFHQLIFS